MDTDSLKDYLFKKVMSVMLCGPHCIHSHMPSPLPHTHTQISKYETNLQIESVSFISESGTSGVSSGGRSGGALILEEKTVAKEIKLTEKVGMPSTFTV